MQTTSKSDVKRGRRSVIQSSSDGTEIAVYDSLTDASIATGICVNSIIACCKGKTKHAGGFCWKYKNESEKKVYCYASDGTFVRGFDSAAEAARWIGVSCNLVHLCLHKERKAARGYQFEYASHHPNRENIEPLNKKTAKRVLQYARDGRYINSFSSIVSAAFAVGCSASNISSCINGKSMTACGYFWREDTGENQSCENLNLESCRRKSGMILQYSKKGEFVNSYFSVKEAAIAVGGHARCISMCINKKTKTACGYVWERGFDNYPGCKNIEPICDKRCKRVLQCSMTDGSVINEFSSLIEAAIAVNGIVGGISQCFRGATKSAYGYIWKEATDEDVF